MSLLVRVGPTRRAATVGSVPSAASPATTVDFGRNVRDGVLDFVGRVARAAPNTDATGAAESDHTSAE